MQLRLCNSSSHVTIELLKTIGYILTLFQDYYWANLSFKKNALIWL